MEELHSNETEQYLTFNLEDEVFALDIAKVREVLEYTKVTKVPQTPEMMIGVINLRGSVVSVIDFRLKLGMPEAARTVNTCIIIAEVELEDEVTSIGFLVDSVKEVVDFNINEIEPSPKIGTQFDTEFIKGMGKKDGAFIIILDIERIFSYEEISAIHTNSELEESVAAL